MAGEVAEIAVQYARAADVRKDQLGDERHGLIVRTRAAFEPGDRPRVVIDLGQAMVGVGDEFVAPSPDAAARVLEVSPRVEGRPDVDMAFDLDHETQESGVYPIVLTSYLIACQTYEDEAQADLVKGYMEYILSDEGQQFGADEAGVAPLADSLQSEALEIVGNISAG